MKVAIASSSLLAIPTLNALRRESDLVAAITMPDAHKGRGQKITPNPFAAKMGEFDLPLYKPVNQKELSELLIAESIDLVVTIAYGRLIKSTALNIPKYGWLNLHFSLLPKFRGAAPVQHAILAGDMKTGLSVFALDEGMDTGPIFEQEVITLTGQENSGEVLEKLSILGSDNVLNAIKKLKSGIAPKAQEVDGGSLAPKITKEMAMINWISGVTQIDRTIRAMTPEPGAWTTFRGERFLISRAEKSDLKAGVPGEIFIDKEILVSSVDGSISLIEVTPAGKRTMSAADWARGARIEAGEKFC